MSMVINSKLIFQEYHKNDKNGIVLFNESTTSFITIEKI